MLNHMRIHEEFNPDYLWDPNSLACENAMKQDSESQIMKSANEAIENADLVGISISVDESSAYYIPINHKNLSNNKLITDQINEKEIIKAIKIICNDPSILKIGHNIKYDLRILEKYNVNMSSIADTMLLSYALDNGVTKHNMDDLAYLHFQHSNIKYKEIGYDTNSDDMYSSYLLSLETFKSEYEI